ncbi:hypothetical protein BDZ90DRAFT_230344 [Jaminaea rosea]|uniref:Secreted protein n=1 Tax=Jaminaea rosea TaxID=1569628 RepID=A0A316UYT2_9BASI|nr:hypothetical protein BDZ90DRAFT_230344 [Jaminaea rosea]PWN29471.1 hypothetical protein BDZ90DRAFT_230344 [Jaminaea rosea]
MGAWLLFVLIAIETDHLIPSSSRFSRSTTAAAAGSRVVTLSRVATAATPSRAVDTHSRATELLSKAATIPRRLSKPMEDSSLATTLSRKRSLSTSSNRVRRREAWVREQAAAPVSQECVSAAVLRRCV